MCTVPTWMAFFRKLFSFPNVILSKAPVEFYKVLICSPLICNTVLDKYRVAGKEKDLETNQACLLSCTTEKLGGLWQVPRAVVPQEGHVLPQALWSFKL